MEDGNHLSLRGNPLAQSLGQVKLYSDKWKRICFNNFFLSKFGFRATSWKKLRQRLSSTFSISILHNKCDQIQFLQKWSLLPRTINLIDFAYW
jgi:hypothetical protein